MSLQEFDLNPGDKIKRTELHQRFGGGPQGGISPCGKSPNVLIFTNPRVGSAFGYNFDGFQSDGAFHYSGEGQVGDQRMRAGNKAIRDHRKDGRHLRVFDGCGGVVTYIGEFILDHAEPHHTARAPDRENNSRDVIVFHLRAAT